MKTLYTLKRRLICAAFLIGPLLWMGASAWALDPGNYTIIIERVNSDGTVTGTEEGGESLGLSAEATADANGKVSFDISGIPDSSASNFLVVEIKDQHGNTVRKSVVPSPDPDGTLLLGVSGITTKQADAVLAAFQGAGRDDPILAVLLYTIIRSTGVQDAELAALAEIAVAAIYDQNGFVDYLQSQRNVTDGELAEYRKNIVKVLANPDTGFAKLFKDSVDGANNTEITPEELQKRGEAAAQALKSLLDAAGGNPLSPDFVLEAFFGMPGVILPILIEREIDETLGHVTSLTVQRVLNDAVNKLKAERNIEVYAQAMETLGASMEDLATFQAASNNLLTDNRKAFAVFDAIFSGDELPTEQQVQDASQELQNRLSANYQAFQDAVTAPDERVQAVVETINAALDVPGLPPGASFEGPIMILVPIEFALRIFSAGGQFTYTRDDLEIPVSLNVPGRTNFDGLPSPLKELFGLQEDIAIALISSLEIATPPPPGPPGPGEAPPSPEEDLRRLFEAILEGQRFFTDHLEVIAGLLTGDLTEAQKRSLVTAYTPTQLGL